MQGAHEEGIGLLVRTLKINPKSAEAFFNLGTTLQLTKHHADAFASCDKALALKPNYAEAHCNRGAVLRQLGRHVDALVSYDRALAVKPDYKLAKKTASACSRTSRGKTTPNPKCKLRRSTLAR
jgi:tetratricopeptide (TPR) repeat protein